jgi:endoglucanase
MKSLLEKLTAIPGPSGYENRIRSAIQAEIEKYTDDFNIDGLGNLIAHKRSLSSDSKNILLITHMDEIGFIVTNKDKSGYARFTNLGKVPPASCPGRQVEFLDGDRGLIGSSPNQKNEDSVQLEDMFIDFGMIDKQKLPVKIGDIAVFAPSFADIGDCLVSKAMDGRVGATILIEILRRINKSPNEITMIFSVQKQVGLRGSSAVAIDNIPDMAIAIDVTPEIKHPNQASNGVKLGHGPGILLKSGRYSPKASVKNALEHAANSENIACQHVIRENDESEAAVIQKSYAGINAGGLCVPCRYQHTAAEMVNMDDISNTVELLYTVIMEPNLFTES